MLNTRIGNMMKIDAKCNRRKSKRRNFVLEVQHFSQQRQREIKNVPKVTFYFRAIAENKSHRHQTNENMRERETITQT